MESRLTYLTAQFWGGKRWVVVDSRKGAGDRLDCFEDYLDAAEFCHAAGIEWAFLRVKLLGSLLKQLRGMTDQPIDPVERDRLREVIGRYPIRLFTAPAIWESRLINGHFYPMVWEKLTHPLLAVRKYIILLEREPGKGCYQELTSTEEFSVAMIRLEAQRVSHRKGMLLLVGQLVEGDMDYRNGEVCDGNETILFYKVAIEGGDNSAFMQVNDPGQRVTRSFPMFVRYHAGQRFCTFYDSRLTRIRPGDEPAYIDLHCFDFGEDVIG